MRVLTFVLLLTACSAAESAAKPASVVDEPAYRSAMAAVKRANPALPPVCTVSMSAGGEVVRYIGMTDEFLLECVGRFADKAHLTLVITSYGGNVDTAIAAAYVIWLRQWDVEVVGICASSCGNYLLPAARGVAVSKYALVLLHGGPTEEIVQAFEKDAPRIVGGSMKGPPDVVDAAVRDNIARMRTTLAAHESFVRALSVAPLWYGIDADFAAQYAKLADKRSPLRVADSAMFKACSGGHSYVRFWDPDAREWPAMEQLFHVYKLLRRTDRGPYTCE